MAGRPVSKFSCLIVEDDVAFATMAAQVVRDESGEPTVCHTLADAREAVTEKSFEVVLLDNHLPDGKGYEFFDHPARRNPDAPIVMITGVPDLGEAVALTRNGLFEYLTKPISVDALAACLQRVKLRLATRELPTGGAEFPGDSAPMCAVRQQLRQAAKHPASTVLFTGETGSGKDMAARALHQLTHGESSAPFIAVNCAALPGDMFESELFGAERGAYTGAERKRAGLVAAAAGGTLFLDEIAEVPLVLQAKLLRLLDAHEFRSLGSTENQRFTGRFVAATNKHLAEEVKAGRFREDLLYRINVVEVRVPPLRERREDILHLATRFLEFFGRAAGRPGLELSPDAEAALLGHSWPGNVRELRNTLERAVILWPARVITRQAFPERVEQAATGRATPGGDITLEALEREHILAVIGRTATLEDAAKVLGLDPSTLWRRRKKYEEDGH